MIAGDDRWVAPAEQIRDQFPDQRGKRLRSQPFGDRYIADGYIYPATMVPGFPRIFS